MEAAHYCKPSEMAKLTCSDVAPLETTLHRYVWLYNQQLPQSALGSKSPLQAMKDWHKIKPELFRKQPYYLPGCDN